MTVAIDGLPLHTPGHQPGEIVLSGLPFEGKFLVGRKFLFADEVPDGLEDWTGHLLPHD